MGSVVSEAAKAAATAEVRETVWVCKHALDVGVQEWPIDPKYTDETSVYVTHPNYRDRMVLGKDCSFEKEVAVKLAESLRDKRIASLRKKIAEIERLDFDR